MHAVDAEIHTVCVVFSYVVLPLKVKNMKYSILKG